MFVSHRVTPYILHLATKFRINPNCVAYDTRCNTKSFAIYVIPLTSFGILKKEKYGNPGADLTTTLEFTYNYNAGVVVG
jgi:hypothetical protein